MSGFQVWWSRVLADDEESIRAAERGRAIRNSLTSCVFCGVSLETRLHDAIKSTLPGAGLRSCAMLAWWQVGDLISASGLYCVGRHGCLSAAERAGTLLDTHAEYATGTNAVRELERIAFTYSNWEPSALRRLVLVCTELSHFPTLGGRK